MLNEEQLIELGIKKQGHRMKLMLYSKKYQQQKLMECNA